MLKLKEMQNFRREGGITLIALIITIIILVILAAVSINAAYNSGIINYAVNGTENYIREADKEKASIKNAQTVVENALLNVNPFVENKGVNTPKITEGMIPIRWDEIKGKWVVCARDDDRWYDYTEEKMEWANMMLSDGKYKAETVEVGQDVADADLGSMFVWIPRYAYSMTHYKSSFAGTADTDDGTTQGITNVVFLKGTTNEGADGITYARNYNAAEVEAAVAAEAVRAAAASEDPTPISTPMIVHPAFTFGGKELTGIWVAKFEASMEGPNANTKEENNVTTKTVKVLPNAESWRYINVGNAFKVCYEMRNKIDAGTNKNLYGITTNTNTHLMKNSEWGAIAYLAASQYGTIPTKNGNGSAYTDNNKTKYHAYTAGSSTAGDYETYKAQSTTGTVNGVYDMNGGAWEYVAAYWDNGYSENDKTKNLFNYGNTSTTNPNMFILNSETKRYKLDSTYAAYWDKYDVYSNPYYAEQNDIDGSYGYNELEKVRKNQNGDSTLGNTLVAKAAYERVQLMKNKKGDAMYEVINTFSYWGWNGTAYSWLRADYDEDGEVEETNDDTTANSDISGVGYYGGDRVQIGPCIYPFILRGGYWNDTSTPGVFRIYNMDGQFYQIHGFRPVITQ